MAKAPAFQLYAADFYMDTLTWETDDIGVYFCLLMAEWVNGPLPMDPKDLAKIAKKTVQKFNKNFSKISHKFYQTEDGFYVNLRLEDERRKQEKYSESQSERANKRWGKDDASADAPVMPAQMPAQMPEGCSSSSSSKDIKAIPIIECKQPVDNSDPDDQESPPFNAVPDDPKDGSLEKIETPKTGNTHGERWTKKQAEEMEILMQEIGERWKAFYHQKVYVWLQMNFNDKNPEAILICLRRLIQERLKGEKIPLPEKWLDAVLMGTKAGKAGENGKCESDEFDQEQIGKNGPPTQRGMAAIGKVFQNMGRAPL